MLLSKEMIDLIIVLKRRFLSEFEIQLKLADPNILNIIAERYPRTKEPLTRELIHELMKLAGPVWLKQLEELDNKPVTVETHFYRGHPVDPGLELDTQLDAARPKKPPRYYRGQLIPDD